MDRLQELIMRAQTGEMEAEAALLALFNRDLWEMSLLTENPDDTFNSLRGEFVLAIRGGRIRKLLDRHKIDTNIERDP